MIAGRSYSIVLLVMRRTAWGGMRWLLRHCEMVACVTLKWFATAGDLTHCSELDGTSVMWTFQFQKMPQIAKSIKIVCLMSIE